MTKLRRFLAGITSALPAVQRKGAKQGAKRVWRISEKVPNGEWVDPDTTPAELSRVGAPKDSSSGWVISSMDLLDGTDVVESQDTVPGEPVDELAAFYRLPRHD